MKLITTKGANGTKMSLVPLLGTPLPDNLAAVVQSISRKVEGMMAARPPVLPPRTPTGPSSRPESPTRSAVRISAQLNTLRAQLLETVNSHEVKNPEVAPVSPLVSVLLAKLCVFGVPAVHAIASRE